MEKKRIDLLLVEQGFFDSREKAKRAIMAGIVHNDHEIIDKPGTKVPVDMELFVKGSVMPYVSRGGLKLEKALKYFDITMTDRVMVDIGSSTGGFTDCALQNKAKRVYAVDVGTNQLVWKLRNDSRVVVKEKTNFRHATTDLFEYELPNIATIDVSFISLTKILPEIKKLLKLNSFATVLIKPQFECGREFLNRSGIVKNPKVHRNVIKNIVQEANKTGLSVVGLTNSPIKGGDGNTEYLLYLKNESNPVNHISLDDIEILVKSQFED